jgi:hypothetical protein
VSGTSAALIKGIVAVVVVVHMSGISYRKATTSRRWTCYIKGLAVRIRVSVCVRKQTNRRSIKESSETSRENN